MNLKATLAILIVFSAQAQAQVSYPLRVMCRSESGSMTFEGVLPEPASLNESQKAWISFNGVSAEAEYRYEQNCFYSRAGQRICPAPHRIVFEFSADLPLLGTRQGSEEARLESKFYGSLDIYDDAMFFILRELVGSRVAWSDFANCTQSAAAN
jgi:hypothetical protein